MNTSTFSRTRRAQFLLAAVVLSGALVAPAVQAQAQEEVSPDAALHESVPVSKRFDFDVERAIKSSWLSINGISYHFDRKNPHNERNWGLGLDIPLSDHSSLMIGRYKNSDWRQSNYAWYVNTPWSLGKVQLGWMAGLATGYHSNPNSPMFVGGLAATIRNDKVGVNVICLPPALCAANLTVKVW